MGSVYLQPQVLDADDISSSALVLYPHRLSKSDLAVAVEWAAGSQTPIFCLSSEIPKLVSEGFGAYRFHRLDGFREIDFQGGTLQFFPARRPKNLGLRGVFSEVGELFGVFGVQAFHVLIRPRGEAPVLYLGTPQIDSVEWDVFMRSQPSNIIGSAEYSQEDWNELGLRTKRKIQSAEGGGLIRTTPVPSKLRPSSEGLGLWTAAKAGSFS